MKRILLFFFLVFVINLKGQYIRGKVVDAGNQALPVVQVLNLSNDGHTHTDDKGAFALPNCVPGDTLQFSSLGYGIENRVVQSLEEIMFVTMRARIFSLDEVVILPRVTNLNALSEIDVQINPVNSSQEILRQVPGLFIGQHAGGGKAEQIFLRGFDIDHGTDIALTFDGLPVNMVSHAHGQGYSDLHFIIPETIENIDFGKGPYYTERGNFNTAGYVEFKSKNRLDNNLIKAETGSFNSQRILGMLNLLDSENQHAYAAVEFLSSDGPFESPQHFKRTNAFAKYSGRLNAMSKIGISIGHFFSNWDASGQIPQRSVDAGSISRFGAIDDTEGGQTSRTNLALYFDKFLNDNAYISSTAFYSRYDFELYSNFTFFLEDPVNGDQIRQKESRNLIGFSSEYNQSMNLGPVAADIKLGLSLRNDEVSDNELSGTANRYTTLRNIQLGDVSETNTAVYGGADFRYGHLTFNAGLRMDYFSMQYTDHLSPAYNRRTANAAVYSPKASLFYSHSQKFQAYVKAGKGFHSNDSRLASLTSSGLILPAAIGWDAGVLWKPHARWFMNLAYWQLFSEQEFVYVGDAGIVEASGASHRSGVDVSLRFQASNSLFWNFDTNYTLARSNEGGTGENYIPLAPSFTLVSGLNYESPSGIILSLKARHMADRPATENNEIIADGYTVFDANAGVRLGRFTVNLIVQNLFDTAWNETQFATLSRLPGEEEGVEEIHFTPGAPRNFRLSCAFRF